VLRGDLAEDAAQEALIRGWRSASRMVGADPKPWIRTIARREALRQLSARTAVDPITDDRQGSQSSEAEVIETRLALLGSLRMLPSEDRRDLLLRHWGDMTTEAIATRTQRPEGTVKVRLHRAHARLSVLLETPRPSRPAAV
jgi:RNA polymerase sigma factor (sigma-70 family)